MLRKIAILLALIVIGGCKKYPEDEKLIHLRTAKNRLCTKWVLQQEYHIPSNVFISEHYDEISLFPEGMSKGQTFNPESGYYTVFEGTWKFIDKKNSIEITNIKNQIINFKIIQLDHDRLKLENDSLGYIFERPRFK